MEFNISSLSESNSILSVSGLYQATDPVMSSSAPVLSIFSIGRFVRIRQFRRTLHVPNVLSVEGAVRRIERHLHYPIDEGYAVPVLPAVVKFLVPICQERQVDVLVEVCVVFPHRIVGQDLAYPVPFGYLGHYVVVAHYGKIKFMT